MKKIIYNTIGSVALMLGLLGALLPLLPTTCFILLASWAFAKSSPTFHNWMYYRSPFAKSIQNWDQNKIIPNRVKIIASLSILASFTFSVIYIENIYVLIALGLILIAVLMFIISKPAEIEAVSYQPTPKLHQPIA